MAAGRLSRDAFERDDRADGELFVHARDGTADVRRLRLGFAAGAHQQVRFGVRHLLVGNVNLNEIFGFVRAFLHLPGDSDDLARGRITVRVHPKPDPERIPAL